MRHINVMPSQRDIIINVNKCVWKKNRRAVTTTACLRGDSSERHDRLASEVIFAVAVSSALAVWEANGFYAVSVEVVCAGRPAAWFSGGVGLLTVTLLLQQPRCPHFWTSQPAGACALSCQTSSWPYKYLP